MLKSDNNTNSIIAPIVEEYERWEKFDGVSELDQALHPTVLEKITWDETTPEIIAEHVLNIAHLDKVIEWVNDRLESHWMERGGGYDKVHKVREEIERQLGLQRTESESSPRSGELGR